jgi:hypothetical protein
MSEEALESIVEEIGLLADKAEASKWELAKAISEAYQEMPAYSRGLTSGLCSRLKRSTDSIYGLRDAFDLKNLLDASYSLLSVSHFTALAHLKDKYNLTEDDCIRWIDWAEQTDSSVRDMSIEVSTAHCADAKKAYLKLVNRVQKDVERLWADSETIGLPDSLRAACKAALGALRDWIAQLLEWGNGNST